MEVTAISNNLSQVNSSEKIKINVGYKVQPTAEKTSKVSNCDTYENKEFVDKVKSQIKDRIANLKVPNILDIEGTRCSQLSTVQ